MGQMRTAAVTLGAILVATTMSVAGPAPGPAPLQAKAKTAKVAAPATRSVSGVVKSVDATTLVIERGRGKNKRDMTFTLDATTRRAGDISVGSSVAVQYKTEASKLMAVSIEAAKGRAAARKTAAR